MKSVSPLLFICHATEDKDAFVRPLAEALKSAGLSVWYDEFSLRPGDSLRESIDRGLALCRHAIVVLSRAFFAKRWTQWELNGLVHRHLANDRDVIIPVWLDVDADFVSQQSPSLADIVAFRAERGIEPFVSFLRHTLSDRDADDLPPLKASASTLSAHATRLLNETLKSSRELMGVGADGSDDDVHVTLMLVDATGDEPLLVRGPSTHGTSAPSSKLPLKVPLRSSLTGLTFSEQKPVRIDDLNSWSSSRYRVAPLHLRSPSSLVAALVTADTDSGQIRLGVVSVMFQRPLKSLSDNQRAGIMRFVQCLGSLCATIIYADTKSNPTGT